MHPLLFIFAANAFDYVALFYWFMTFVALAILVASLYRSVNPPSQEVFVPQANIIASQQYFISIQSNDADIRIDLAAESLQNKEYMQSAKYSYEAVEFLLTNACSKMGLDSSHNTLAELAQRLASSGLLGIDTQSFSYLDSLKPFDAKKINEAAARRALLIASQVREYFKQAPLKIQR